MIHKSILILVNKPKCVFQLYVTLFPTKAAAEVNLSMLWCLLAVGFAYKILVSLTGLYFAGEESEGERSLVIVMGFAYLLFAMMILVVQVSIFWRWVSVWIEKFDDCLS
jgi:hypothetical protein